MKKKFTQICFVAMIMLMAGTTYAATITATVSGNWSNATTWSGGSASGTVGLLDDVIIPAGITVTLDMDVQVNFGGTINVSGALNSSNTHSLMINNSGTLSGNGDLNLYYVELSALSTMNFTGDLMVNRFVTSATTLNLGAQVTLADTLHLKAGTLTLGSGSMLMLNTNSNIKVEDGTLAIGTGVFTATNMYNVMYVGSTKTTGLEWSGTGANNMYVHLSSNTQSLTLASAITVNGTLYHNMGTLKLGSGLTLNGDYSSMNNSMIEGSSTSDLIIHSANSLTSDIKFNSGTAARLRDLEINIISGNMNIGSDIVIYGHLNLINGDLNLINSSALTLNGGSHITRDDGEIIMTSGSNLNGNASYDVRYIGISKTAGVELSGLGLNNVDIDLGNFNSDVNMSSNTIVNGTLMLQYGSLNLNGQKLEIKGNFSSQDHGTFKGNSTSDLYINTTNGINDTVNFYGVSNQILRNFSINTGNSSSVMLGSDLWVENLIFVDGGITIYNNDLHLNSTGTITGYDSDNYVITNGSGSLMMNVNSSSPYVTFPIGTSLGYSPAHIQKTFGTDGMMSVNARNGVWTSGTSGTDYSAFASVVNRTWNITSAPTGSTNVSMRLEWNTTMEVNGFNRNNSYITQYTSNWDNTAASTATTTGTGTYMMQRDNVTSFGPFAVVDNLSTVNVKELAENNNVSFYPNPATENVTMTVKNSGAYSIEVFDAIGNLIISKIVTTEPSTKVDMSSLNTGVYFVKISDDKTQSIKKIIKQ